MTSHQLCDHYTSLIEGLNSPPLWLALQVELRTNGHKYGDVEETVKCITKVLTIFIARDERENERAASARALSASTKHRKDPQKGGLQADKSGPDTPCRLCGKMHWHSQCFQNPKADDDTRRLAMRLAPKSPAATGIKPTKPQTSNETVKIQDTPNEAPATLTAQHASEADDIIAAALNNTGPETILLGQAKMASQSDYMPYPDPPSSDDDLDTPYYHDTSNYEDQLRSFDDYLASLPKEIPSVATAVPVVRTPRQWLTTQPVGWKLRRPSSRTTKTTVRSL